MDELAGLRVLVVEDEGGIAMLIEDMIEEARLPCRWVCCDSR